MKVKVKKELLACKHFSECLFVCAFLPKTSVAKKYILFTEKMLSESNCAETIYERRLAMIFNAMVEAIMITKLLLGILIDIAKIVIGGINILFGGVMMLISKAKD